MCTQSMMVKVMIVKVMMEQIYTSIHFLTGKTYDVEADKASDSGQDVYTDEMRFNSLADYEDFLIWGTDYRDQYF